MAGNAVVSASNTAPARITRIAPKRSASAPTTGWASPTANWPKARARLSAASPMPEAVLSGETKRPNAVRPPDTRAMRVAAARVRRQAAAFIREGMAAPLLRLEG